MADNVTLKASVGTFVARADDKGNGLIQVFTLDAGADGTEKIIRAGQQVMADSLPVVLASNQSNIPTNLDATVKVHDNVNSGTPSIQLVGAVRRDANSSPVSADGDYSYLTMNEDGRLKVASAPAQLVAITGAITAAAQTVAGDVSSCSNITCYVTGTFVGHNVTFEGSIDGGTNWFAVQGVRTNANTIELVSGVLGAAPAYAWEFSVNALTNFRVRATAHTSGTANWRFNQGSYATEPIPAIQTHAVTQSGTFTVGLSAAQTLAAVTSANLGFPGIIADVASAALTTTTTTAAFTPTFGCSYEINIPVTVVSGTNPTLDVVVQESDDSGTNWFDVYHFPRITATGMYRSRKLPLTGNRVRYVQTVSGTTPSFTRAINRLQSSDTAQTTYRRLFDRSMVSTQALNAVTPSLIAATNEKLQLVIAAGAITTTAPAFKLQGSDDNGVSWYDIPGGTLTAVASSTVQVTVANFNSELIRAIVTTAGSGATLTYVSLKAF